MRILLVQPAPFEDMRLGLENTVWMSEPVALTSIAAMVPGHDVEIIDLRIDPSQTLPERLRAFKPHMVGVTAMTTDAYQALAVLRNTKEILPDALTLIGGHHPTLMPEFFHKDYVDIIVKGEGEEVFKDLCQRWSEQIQQGDPDRNTLASMKGTEVRTDTGWVDGGKSAWIQDLDSIPAPSRDLIRKYSKEYFYVVGPMASIFTSRGCSFDCNFCAIWEFYDRRTRFLSAKVIADRMEACEEDFIFLLDDNFLTRPSRLWELADELESRGIRKYWMTQGRADFVAKYPDLIKRLASVGMAGLLSGYESNAQNALDHLRKRANVDANMEASRILRENGIVSTGIFMVRPDFEKQDFEDLYNYIIDMGIALPMVTIQTPLPATELWKQSKDKLLTEDFRFYDLGHAVVPTKLPREEFYKELVKWRRVLRISNLRWFTTRQILRRPGFYKKFIPFIPRILRNRFYYHPIHFNHLTYLRSEEGIIPLDNSIPDKSLPSATPEQQESGDAAPPEQLAHTNVNTSEQASA